MAEELPPTVATELTASMTLLPEDRTALRRAARKMADAEAFRAEVIRRAVSNGASAREVAAEVGLSHTWVRKLATTDAEAST